MYFSLLVSGIKYVLIVFIYIIYKWICIKPYAANRLDDGWIEKCEGKLRVEKIDSDYHPTIWHTSESRYVFIEMDRKDLRLFMILEFGDKKEIVFYIPIKND